MRENSLMCVRNLAPLGEPGLLRLKKMGQGSVRGLSILLYQALLLERGLSIVEIQELWTMDGALSERIEVSSTKALPPSTLAEGLRQAIDSLPEKRSSILAARWGFGREQKTLQEIGTDLGITRERVRQIEARAYREISSNPIWAELEHRLTSLLKDRQSSLLLAGMHELDPWLQGAQGNANALREVFRHLLRDRYGIFEVGGALAVSQITLTIWNDTLEDAQTLLKGMVKDLIDEDHARTLIHSLLAGRGEELRDELWEEAIKECLWAETPGRPRRLSGFNSSALDLVLAILRSSASPLTVSEIYRRAAAMGHTEYEEIYLRNSCQAGAILYGRSLYGLPEHCPLDAAQMVLIRGEVEDIIFAGAPSRQWHTSELLEAMQSRGLDFDGVLNKYVLNFTLRESPNLAYLQRMVWQQRQGASDGAASRLDARQAVISVLEAAGKPLSYLEIREKLMQGRGVNDHFQIHAAPPLIRIGPGTWGLIGRDTDDAASRPLLELLRRKLEEVQCGIHLSELAHALGESSLADDLAATSLLSLARSVGVRMDRHRYAYLEQWKSSRRMGVAEAAMQAIKEQPEGATIEVVCSRVVALTRREIPRATISSVLQGCAVSWDSATALWRLSTEETETLDDEGALL
jgi:hypothetical protein